MNLKIMTISRKENIITETTKDYLLTLSLTQLVISELNTFETIKSIELDEIQNLNLVQLIPIGESILIFDIQKCRIIYVNEAGFPNQIMFPRKVTAGKFIVTQSNDNKLLLFNLLMYYELDLNTKRLSEISGVHVMKHYANFRHVMRDLFAIKYNYLYYDDKQRKVLYHFHNDQKVIYEDKDFEKPYYFHDESSISRIGIYDVELQQKQVEFPAPEIIAFGGWFGWTDDGLSSEQSVLRGIIEFDKIILCYPKIIYVMSLEGKVLETIMSENGKRFTGVNPLKKNEIIIVEFSEKEQLTEIKKRKI
jgi:hypothetical protein